MWIKACTVIDEPIMVAFWEIQDAQILLLAPFLLQFLIKPTWAFGGAFVLAITVYFLKRGQPSGALLHFLHRWGFWWLPGVLGSYPQRYGSW